MFDFSFYELIVFGIIALIVLGPEKLPHAVRKAGTYYAKFRRTVNTLKTEMEAELDLAETRQKMQEELAKIRQAEADMQKEMAQLRGNMQALKRESETAAKLQKQSDSLDTPDSLPAATAILPLQTPNPAAISPQASAPKSEAPLNPIDTQTNFDKKMNEIEPPNRPWQHRWFVLGDYDRAKRLPPAPLLPNYQIQPLLHESTLYLDDTGVTQPTSRGEKVL